MINYFKLTCLLWLFVGDVLVRAFIEHRRCPKGTALNERFDV